MNKKYLNFDIDSIDVIDENTDSQFAYAKIFAFASGQNKNKLYCSPETLKNTALSIENCPILYNFSGSLWGNWDVGTHTSPDKSLICGFIEPGSIEFNELNDGRLGLFVTGRVWKKYSEKLMKIFSRNSTKKVSVEMEMYESCDMQDNPKIEEMLDFKYFGVCILGDQVEEAVDGANIDMISFSKENDEYKKAYHKEFSKYEKCTSRYSEIDFSIPDQVRINASEGLDIAKTGSVSSGAVYMAIARHLINSNKVSHDKVRFINKNIKSKINSEKNTPDYLSFMLMGGKESLNWSKEISDKMDDLDSKTIAYFNDCYNELKENLDKKDENMGFALEKDKWGDGNNIPIDKSKEVMSNSSWGDINKSNLMESVLKASNYKSLVKDVYALVEDGWEDAPSEHLKYPIMELSNGKFIYNRNALSAAKGRAEEQKEESVINKLNKIYSELGLNDEKEVNNTMADKEKENDEVENKEQEMAVNTEAEIGTEEDKENKEKENSESPKEQKEEKEKNIEKKMSFDSYLDVAAVMGFLTAQTEDNKTIAEKYSKGELNDEEFAKAMFSTMCKMSEQIKTYADENKSLKDENMSLKEFKTKVEKDNFDLQVESFMQDFQNALPKEEFTKAKEDSANFSLETLDAWKNKVGAIAYSFSVGKKQKKQDFVSIAFPFVSNEKQSTNGSKSPWKKINS